MVIAFDDHLWIATDRRMVIINLKDYLNEKPKEIKIDDSYVFTSVSLPDSSSYTLKTSIDKMKLLWFRSNFGMVIVDIKRQELEKLIRNVVKMSKRQHNLNPLIADIEQFLKFDVDAAFKTAVYLTRKNMIGEILHFIDMETSRIIFKWTFYDPHRKQPHPV